MTYMKSLLVLVLLTTLTNEGQMADWLSDLNENLHSLQDHIQQSVQNLQKDIAANVQQSVAHVNEINAKVNADIKEAIKNGAVTSSISGVNGGTVILNSPGISRSITSGALADGKPFWYDVEDKVIGTRLYHTERFYNDTNQGIQVLAYTLDLSDKDAKPVPICEPKQETTERRSL